MCSTAWGADADYANLPAVSGPNGKIELDADQTEELRLFLRTAFERYAAQSITLGVLQPEMFAQNQLMRNIIIVKSTMDTHLRLDTLPIEQGEKWTNFKEQYA